jgi:CO/xanthine dehydrogenase Mo-binding subunit
MTRENSTAIESVLGKSYPRVDAAEKVTGRTVYAGDMHLPGTLVCKLLKSTRPHAKLKRLDTTRAEALPGVKAVVTAADAPSVRFGALGIKDRTLFATERVRFIGEPLAAVAAVDEITALEALDLIEAEYEDLPSVFDPVEAMKPGAPAIHEDLESYEGSTFSGGGNICVIADGDRGDVDAAMKEADQVFEDTCRTQPINQCYLEPMACVADVDAAGRVNVWTSTQGPYAVRATLAEVLETPIAQIRVVPTEMGGGFGAKLRMCLEAFAVILARKTRRPVKMIATREEVFTLSGPRLEARIRLRTGVNKDGAMIARDALAVWDMGAFLGPGVQAGISHGVGAYHIPNFRLRSYGVYTNKVPANSYRASGVADMTFAVESHTDIIARKLDIDPWEFRRRNAFNEGDTSARGDRIPRNGLHQTLDEVRERLAGSETGPDEAAGIALCEWRSGSGASTAQVTLNEDGGVTVLTGSVDISGTDTVLAQIAAQALGIGMEKVVIAKRDTDLAPFTSPSGGSRITYSQGKVVEQASVDVREKAMELAAERLRIGREALACGGGRVYVEDNPEQGYSLGQLAQMAATSRGGPLVGNASLSAMPYAPVFTTQAAGVKVDRQTGKVTLKRLIQAQDVGTAINPMAIVGQLEGGVVQGIGRALMEHYKVEDGTPTNASFTTYLMPLAPDVPPLETILISVPSEDGPFGARAVAEPPGFGPGPAIANAIEEATGVRIKELPLTADLVLAALRGEAKDVPPLDLSFLPQESRPHGPTQWQSGG